MSKNYPQILSTLTNQKYDIIFPEYSIGRNPDSIIPLIHPSISKEHGLLKFSFGDKKLIIRDLHSLNGIYVNGNKIEINKDYILNNNDTIKFGKDNDIYLVMIPEKTMNKEDELLRSNDFYRNEYSKIQEKYNELEGKYGQLQREKEKIEIELKFKEEIINKYKTSDLNYLIEQKEKMIKILQNELNIYKKNLPNYNSINNIISNKLDNDENNQIAKAKYESDISNLNTKIAELTKENQSLIEIIQKLTEQNKIDTEKHNKIILQYDKKIASLLESFPNKISNFNLNKELAAKYLVEQVNEYLQEKETLIKENSQFTINNKHLELENEKLNKEIETTKKIYTIQIEELKSQLDKLKNKNNFIPNSQYQKYLMDIQENVYKKEKEIETLRNKLNYYSNNVNTNFDQNEQVNKISNELYLKDRQIYNLKKNLPSKFQ